MAPTSTTSGESATLTTSRRRQYPEMSVCSRVTPRSSRSQRRRGLMLRASPATHAKASPGSQSMPCTAETRSSPASRTAHVRVTSASVLSSIRSAAVGTSTTACTRVPRGRSSSARAIAGRAVSSPASSSQSTSSGAAAEALGPATYTLSPGRTRRAHPEARPVPCSTKSRATSPASVSTERTV